MDALFDRPVEGDPRPTISTFTDGSVTAVDPLTVVLDGIGQVFPDSLVEAASLEVGDRVRCEIAGRRVVLHGRAGGAGKRTVSYTTSSLANGATETGAINIGAGFTILHFKAVQAARFRAYQSIAHRTADASRAVGVYPTGDHGLIFEDDGSAAADYATVVVGGLLDGETACPISITNRSGSTRTITVELEVRV